MGITAITAVTNAAGALGNLILVTPQTVIGYQPQNASINGVLQPYTQPAILFHYEGEQTSTIESDITDHYVENNTPVQDHIALKPVMITTQGFIGDLNDLAPNAYFAAAQIAAEKLTILSAYTPALSATALLAYNEAVFAYNTVNNLADSAVATWNSINGETGGESVITGSTFTSESNQSPQQKYYQQFYGYWNSRALFTVQTPWAIFTDMAIMSIKAIQGADTTTITDFECTFKQIRYASVLDDTSVYANPNNAQTRLSQQIGAPGGGAVNTGTSVATPATSTLSSSLSTGIPTVPAVQ